MQGVVQLDNTAGDRLALTKRSHVDYGYAGNRAFFVGPVQQLLAASGGDLLNWP
jgi:hypothetical protein